MRIELLVVESDDRIVPELEGAESEYRPVP